MLYFRFICQILNEVLFAEKFPETNSKIKLSFSNLSWGGIVFLISELHSTGIKSWIQEQIGKYGKSFGSFQREIWERHKRQNSNILQQWLIGCDGMYICVIKILNNKHVICTTQNRVPFYEAYIYMEVTFTGSRYYIIWKGVWKYCGTFDVVELIS